MKRIKITLVLGVVLFLATITRFFGEKLLAVPVFDEAIHSTFALMYAHNQPYFDVHPPLVSLIVAYASKLENADMVNIRDQDPRSFGNFPYETVRNLSSFTGLGLVVIIMVISFRFFKSVRSAVFSGMLVIFDPALTIYSRFIFPDIYLLFFGFGSILASTFNGIIPGIISGFLLGLAVSIKWTGLAFGVISGIVLWKYQNKKIVTLNIAVGFITYLCVWIIFFRNVDLKKPVYFPYERYFGQVSLPKSNNIVDILKFLPEHTANMLKVTTLLSQHEAASSPWVWPLGKGDIRLYSANQKEIVLKGNMMWLIGLMAVIWCFVISAKKNSSMGFYEKVLIIGYLFSYIPLFFTGRSLFIYHYFSPLIISYLLLPRVFFVPR